MPGDGAPGVCQAQTVHWTVCVRAHSSGPEETGPLYFSDLPTRRARLHAAGCYRGEQAPLLRGSGRWGVLRSEVKGEGRVFSGQEDTRAAACPSGSISRQCHSQSSRSTAAPGKLQAATLSRMPAKPYQASIFVIESALVRTNASHSRCWLDRLRNRRTARSVGNRKIHTAPSPRVVESRFRAAWPRSRVRERVVPAWRGWRGPPHFAWQRARRTSGGPPRKTHRSTAARRSRPVSFGNRPRRWSGPDAPAPIIARSQAPPPAASAAPRANSP
jgi:hypothetical protein